MQKPPYKGHSSKETPKVIYKLNNSRAPLSSVSSSSYENVDTSYESSIDFRKPLFRGDIQYPIFKRSKSTKRYQLSTEFIDDIKEEKNEEDDKYSFHSSISNRYRSIYPKEEFLLFDSNRHSRPEQLISNLTCTKMDPVPEIEDDNNTRHENLWLKSPRIKIPSDNQEDAKIIPIKPLYMNKTSVPDENVIKEEKENETNDFYFVHSRDPLHNKWETIIDKEEPPDFIPSEGMNINDVINEVNCEGEEDVQSDSKFIIHSSNSRLSQKKFKADEIDEKNEPRIPWIFNKINIENESINEADEYIIGNNKCQERWD